MSRVKRIYVTRSPTGMLEIVKETNRGVDGTPTRQVIYRGQGSKIPISVLKDMSYSKIVFNLF